MTENNQIPEPTAEDWTRELSLLQQRIAELQRLNEEKAALIQRLTLNNGGES